MAKKNCDDFLINMPILVMKEVNYIFKFSLTTYQATILLYEEMPFIKKTDNDLFLFKPYNGFPLSFRWKVKHLTGLQDSDLT